MTTRSELIDELLDDRTYHIEFNGHLTNHAKHAVVALAGLGVPSNRIRSYYENYAKLTPYGFPLEMQKPSSQSISETNWERFFGQRKNFSAYCEFFDNRVRELGLEGVLRRYFPQLLPGWVGSFTHAAVHLGWALDAGSRWMAVEGLAYLAFSYVSCHPERAVPMRNEPAKDRRPIDSLLRAVDTWENDRDALRHWVSEVTRGPVDSVATGIHPELGRSGLQYRIARILDEGHSSMYQTPVWIEEQDVETIWKQLHYVVTLLCLAFPGDFVVLHLITSLHAMEQIADRLTADQQKDTVKCFWIGMLGIVLSTANLPRPSKLAGLHTAFRAAVDTGGAEVWGPDWAQIVTRAAEEEEEHNPKLVYVLQRAWRRTGGRTIYRAAAGQFTATPQLPPSFEEPPNE